jgi:hypothetical protein
MIFSHKRMMKPPSKPSGQSVCWPNDKGNRVGGPTGLTLAHQELQTKETTLKNRKASQLRFTDLLDGLRCRTTFDAAIDSAEDHFVGEYHVNDNHLLWIAMKLKTLVVADLTAGGRNTVINDCQFHFGRSTEFNSCLCLRAVGKRFIKHAI